MRARADRSLGRHRGVCRKTYLYHITPPLDLYGWVGVHAFSPCVTVTHKHTAADPMGSIRNTYSRVHDGLRRSYDVAMHSAFETV
jgi:hypothetical protein